MEKKKTHGSKTTRASRQLWYLSTNSVPIWFWSFQYFVYCWRWLLTLVIIDDVSDYFESGRAIRFLNKIWNPMKNAAAIDSSTSNLFRKLRNILRKNMFSCLCTIMARSRSCKS